MAYLFIRYTFFFIIFVGYCDAEKCVYSGIYDIISSGERSCSDAPVCDRMFMIKSLSLPPYSNTTFLEHMIEQCCGKCLKHGAVNKTSIDYNNKTLSESMDHIRENADFALPFLGAVSSKTLLGWWFIPLVDVHSFFYITPKKVDILGELIYSSLHLYPLIIICLTLAVISGFITWLLETWLNEAEFQRSFLVGWFEGFWWAFITMTTVGYGDKIPKRFVSRAFAIIWIFVGIALFSIVTAQITNIIIRANNPSLPTVRGKNVGVLKYREYDKSYVAKNGGLVYHTSVTTKNDNFFTDLHNLIRTLRTENIDGIILDKSTMSFTMKYLADSGVLKNPEENANAAFMLHKTVRTERDYVGEKMAYGVIVKSMQDYEFFSSAIRGNRFAVMSREASGWNSATVTSNANLFDLEGVYFLTGIKVIFGIIAVIILFGIVYEGRRTKRFCR